MADQVELGPEPRLERGEDRPAAGLANFAACLWVETADLGLDAVELRDAGERLGGDWRGAGGGEFVEAASHMGPTKGQHDRVGPRQLGVASIAVDLQDAGEAGEMREGALALAVGGVAVDDGRRVYTAPGPVVAGISPYLPGLGLAATGIQHRRGRLVGEQARRHLDDLQHALVDRPEQEGALADPVGERRTVEGDVLAGVDLGLAIERQVIGVFGDHDLRYGRLGGDAALDKARRRRCLDDDLLAGPAGIFGPTHDENPDLCRHDVQPLGTVLSDRMQAAAAARAGLVVDVDHLLDARQMGRQRAAVRPPSRRPLLACFGIGDVGRGLHRGDDLFDLLEGQEHLVFRQALGAPTEAMPLQFLDDLTQPLVLRLLGEEHGAERNRVGGEGVGRLCHKTDSSIFVSGLLAVWMHRIPSRRSSRRRRLPLGTGLVHALPVEPLQEGGQLASTQPHDAVADRRPLEPARLQALGVEHHAGAVPPDQLHAVGPLRTEDIDRP